MDTQRRGSCPHRKTHCNFGRVERIFRTEWLGKKLKFAIVSSEEAKPVTQVKKGQKVTAAMCQRLAANAICGFPLGLTIPDGAEKEDIHELLNALKKVRRYAPPRPELTLKGQNPKTPAQIQHRARKFLRSYRANLEIDAKNPSLNLKLLASQFGDGKDKNAACLHHKWKQGKKGGVEMDFDTSQKIYGYLRLLEHLAGEKA